MVDDDLGPEGFSTRGIPSAKRGLDKRVVDNLVAEAVERWAELKRRYNAALEEQAAAVVREAEQQAFQMRGDAWNTGIELLDLVRETSSAIIAEAEDDALLIRAEAERESHRRLAVTRKEQDYIIRNARYELDRHIAMARDLAAEILTTANTEEVALTPTPGQEDRRRELLAGAERLRPTP